VAQRRANGRLWYTAQGAPHGAERSPGGL